jgi:hypothetical protein
MVSTSISNVGDATRLKQKGGGHHLPLHPCTVPAHPARNLAYNTFTIPGNTYCRVLSGLLPATLSTPSPQSSFAGNEVRRGLHAR